MFIMIYAIIMPENYIAMFDTPSVELSEEIIDNAEPSIMEVAKCIREGIDVPQNKTTCLDNLKNGIVNEVFYATIVKAKKFKATDKCIGCRNIYFT